jgi:hypothetical protein
MQGSTGDPRGSFGPHEGDHPQTSLKQVNTY